MANNHDDKFQEWIRDDIKTLRDTIEAISARVQTDAKDCVHRGDLDALRKECEALRHDLMALETARNKIIGGLAVLSAGGSVLAVVVNKFWK